MKPLLPSRGNLFYTHGNHNKHNHKKHRININKKRIKATLYFKEKHLFIYDTLFIHKENWCP